MEDNHIIFKINGGSGAILCSNCRKIICTGDRIPKYIWDALKTHTIDDLPPQFCCQECQDNFLKRNNK